MVNRRTLGDAMTLNSDKLAFIKGAAGTPASTVATPQTSEAAVSSVAVVPTESPNEPFGEAAETQPTTGRSPSRRSRSRGRSEASDDSILLVMSQRWIPLTTKLQPSTAAALKRAGLEQRLAGATPATVQEIVEIAVADWLAKNGFL